MEACAKFVRILREELDKHIPHWPLRNFVHSNSGPPLDVWPETIQAWLEHRQFPRKQTLESLLVTNNFPPESRSRLMELYDKCSTARLIKKKQKRISYLEGSEFLTLSQTFNRFIGRKGDLIALLNIFSNPNGPKAVAIYGLGGIGKTALAYELRQKSQEAKLFEQSVFITSQDEFLEQGRTATNPVPSLNLDRIIAAASRQLDIPWLLDIESTQRKSAFKDYLEQHSVLLILDNLDTVPQRDQIIDEIYPILGAGRLLLTSRVHVNHFGIFKYSLAKMMVEDGIEFIKHEAAQMNITAISSLVEEDIRDLCNKTGCLPLAMRLVVGQLDHYSVDSVLKYLEEANQFIAGTSFENPDYHFYRFIYKRSWDQLDQFGRMLLISMANFPPNIGGSVDLVRQVSRLTVDEFDIAVGQLLKFFLIDKSIDNQKSTRYILHTITQYFVLGDIIKLWIDL